MPNFIHTFGTTKVRGLDMREQVRPYILKIMVSLCIYFVIVQILPFNDWTCSVCRSVVQSHG